MGLVGFYKQEQKSNNAKEMNNTTILLRQFVTFQPSAHFKAKRIKYKYNLAFLSLNCSLFTSFNIAGCFSVVLAVIYFETYIERRKTKL